MARLRSNQEFIIVSKPVHDPRARELYSEGRFDLSLAPTMSILERRNATIRPLFPGRLTSPNHGLLTSGRIAGTAVVQPHDLARFYYVDGDRSQFEELVNELAGSSQIDGAYIKPPGEPPQQEPEWILNSMKPLADSPVRRQNFSTRQGYLQPAPVGVDAEYAWWLPGGKGAGVRVIDCEWGWNFQHKDLIANQTGVVIGISDQDDNHGTAVVGVIGGDPNAFGITGIASDAIVAAASFGGNRPTAQIIRESADNLWAGDIILLEIHRPGPNATQQGQFGYIAIEWWPDDLLAIKYAVAKGIVVVEAAGNGQQNLDDPIYERGLSGFPQDWKNPFNPANSSSGAVLVGAGNPPAGTHDRNRESRWPEDYFDRARCGFSNFGQRVDCQGWGWEVTTTGYGDLQGGPDRNFWYSDSFAGTSSASPIVTGSIAALQGILRAHQKPLLTSPEAIMLLRRTGSVQQDAPGRPQTQRIGNRPDLRELVSECLGDAALRPLADAPTKDGPWTQRRKKTARTKRKT